MLETGKVSKADRVAATAAYLAGPRPVIVLPVQCTCSQYTYPHDAHVAEKATFEAHRAMRYKPDAMQRKNTTRQARDGRNLLPAKNRTRR